MSAEEGRARVRALLARLGQRRSVRDFAPDLVPLDLIDTAIEVARTAPSGANRQPWRFVPFAPGGRFASLLVRDRDLAEALAIGFDGLWKKAMKDLREISFQPAPPSTGGRPNAPET